MAAIVGAEEDGPHRAVPALARLAAGRAHDLGSPAQAHDLGVAGRELHVVGLAPSRGARSRARATSVSSSERAADADQVGDEADQHGLEADDHEHGGEDQALDVPGAAVREVVDEEAEADHARRRADSSAPSRQKTRSGS